MSTPASKMERRNFVALCLAGSGAVVGTGILSWKMAGQGPRPAPTHADYVQQLNTTFNVTLSDADKSGAHPVPLKLIRVSDAVIQPAGPRRLESYSILFEGKKSDGITQQTVTIQHPQLGEQQLLIVPVGKQKGDVAIYEASFSAFQ